MSAASDLVQPVPFDSWETSSPGKSSGLLEATQLGLELRPPVPDLRGVSNYLGEVGDRMH